MYQKTLKSQQQKTKQYNQKMDKRYKQTFHQRRYTDIKKAQKDMCNVIRAQEDAS